MRRAHHCDIISIKVESPEMNSKSERRLDLCHRNFFLARYEARKAHLCYVDLLTKHNLSTSTVHGHLLLGEYNIISAETKYRYIHTESKHSIKFNGYREGTGTKPLKQEWGDVHTINVLLSAIPIP